MTHLLESTYEKIHGKSKKQSPSIGGLIRAHTLSTKKPSKKLASAKRHKRKKIVNANYSTLNELFHDLEASSSPSNSSISARAH